MEEENGNTLRYSCLKKVPWTKMPGRLQPVRSQRGHTTEQLTPATCTSAAGRARPLGSQLEEIFRTRDSAPLVHTCFQSAPELTVRRGVTRLMEWETAPGWRPACPERGTGGCWRGAGLRAQRPGFQPHSHYLCALQKKRDRRSSPP